MRETGRILLLGALFLAVPFLGPSQSVLALNSDGRIGQLQRYVAAHPTEVMPKFKLGLLYMNNRQFNEAVEEWRGILFSRSMRISTIAQVKIAKFIAIAYYKMGNWGKAWKFAKWSYQKCPKDHKEYPGVVKVARAVKTKIKRILLARKRRQMAARNTSATTAGGAVPAGPKPPKKVEKKVSLDEAKTAFKTGKELYEEGRLLLRQDNEEYEVSLAKAVENFKIAALGNYLPPRTKFYLGSTMLLLSEDETLPEAQKYLEESLKEDTSEDEETYFNLGKVYGLMAKKDKEIEAYEKAVAINPDNADYHFHLALAYDKSPREDAPRKTFEHAKAAIRLKSEYKRRFQEVLKNSEVARKIAGIVRDIIEKTENDELTDEETERYAKKIQDMLGEKIDPNDLSDREKIKDMVKNNKQAQDLIQGNEEKIDKMLKNPNVQKKIQQLQRKLSERR